MQPRTRLVVGAAGADDHGRGRLRRPAPAVGGELRRRRLAPRGPGGSGSAGNDIGGGVRFGETLLDGARVALTEYPCAKASIGGEWRATRMRPCPTERLRHGGVATTSFSDGPHTLGHCATDFAGNVSCAHPGLDPDRQQPARASARSHPRRWRRLAPRQRLRSRRGRTPTRARQPDRRRLLADHRAGRLRQRRPVRRRPRPHARCSDLSVPARRAPTRLRLAARRGRQRGPASAAIAVPLRFDDVAAGRRLRAAPPGTRAADADPGATSPTPTPARRAGRSTTGVSTPSSGRSCRRSSSAARPPDSADADRARCRATSAPGTYVFRADAVDAAGNAASTTRRADGTEMAVRKVAGAPVARGRPRRPVGARPASSPVCAGGTTAARPDRARSAWRRCSAAACSTPRRRAGRPRAAGRLPALARRPAPSAGSTGPDRAARRLPPPPARRALASCLRRLRRRRAVSTAPRAVRSRCGCAAGSSCAPRRRGLRTGEAVRLSAAGSAPSARRCRAAESWSRSSTTSRRRGAGGRSSSPAATTAAASTPATGSATSAARRGSGCARCPGRGALALRARRLGPMLVRVSG